MIPGLPLSAFETVFLDKPSALAISAMLTLLDMDETEPPFSAVRSKDDAGKNQTNIIQIKYIIDLNELSNANLRDFFVKAYEALFALCNVWQGAKIGRRKAETDFEKNSLLRNSFAQKCANALDLTHLKLLNDADC